MAFAQAPQQLMVFGSQYCLPYEVQLVMREGWSISGEDMDILDSAGVRHFKLRSKLVSLHKKRVLYDASGIPVCSTVKKLASLRHTMYVSAGAEASDVSYVAEVRKAILHLKPHLQVFLKGNTTGVPDLDISGSFFDRSYTIAAGAMVLAQATRDMLSLRSNLTNKDTYLLRVMPGVDVALMVALVACVDDISVDEKKEKH